MAASIRCLLPPSCPLLQRMGIRFRQTPTPKALWGYTDARCNYTNPAVAIGRTADSAVVICETGVGRFYYKGFGLQNGQSVEIDDPVQTGGALSSRQPGLASVR